MRDCLFLGLLLFSGASLAATELGIVTLAEGAPQLLRGATFYKLAAGSRIQESDIVSGFEKSQVQIEFSAGSIVSFAGAGFLYLMPAAKANPQMLALPSGWLKVAAKAPGLRIRTAAFDVQTPDGTLVVHAQEEMAELFVESGRARLIELTRSGGDGPTREAKRGEYWAKPATGAFSTVARAPKPFVQAMPRHFIDLLPVLATKTRARTALVVDHEITYAEAEPWLAGRDRAVFERRFAVRLGDPEFRRSAEPDIHRYPAWDRRLHPEKFAPKEAPAK